MRHHAAYVASMVLIPALFACRERMDRDKYSAQRGSQGTGLETPPSPSPSNKPDMTGSAADKSDKSKVNPIDNDAQAVAKIHGKGPLAFAGTVKIRDVTAEGGLGSITLTNSTPGLYSVRVFDTSDCSSVPAIDPETGAIESGPGASLVKHEILASLGEVTVEKDGNGTLNVSLKDIKSGAKDIGAFDHKAVGFFAKKPIGSDMKGSEARGGQPGAESVPQGQLEHRAEVTRSASPLQPPDACGVLSTSKEDIRG